MASLPSFLSQALIVNHFTELKNKIGIKTEAILSETNLSEAERNIINDIRREQLNKIDEVQNKNISSCTKFDEDSYKAKWQHKWQIDGSKLTHEQKVELCLEELISKDMLLLGDPTCKLANTLLVAPFYCSKRSLEFLR